MKRGINVGFLSENWNVKKQVIKEDISDPKAEGQPYDPMKDTELIDKIKSMIAEYKKTNDQKLLHPIMEEMSKLYAPEAKEIVAAFENDKLKTTRGNYGKYMSFLSPLKGLHRGAMVFALRDAGAGKGLDDALMVLKGSF